MSIDVERERRIVIDKVTSLMNAVRGSINAIESQLSNLKSEVNTILPNYPGALSDTEMTELSDNISTLETAIADFKTAVKSLTIKR